MLWKKVTFREVEKELLGIQSDKRKFKTTKKKKKKRMERKLKLRKPQKPKFQKWNQEEENRNERTNTDSLVSISNQRDK